MNELRLLPYSEECERGVLGSILLDPSGAMRKCFRIGLDSSAFYDRRHQTLYAELVSMAQKNSRCMDAITIAEWLKSKSALEKVGGYDYLIELQDSTIVPAHVEHYAATLQRCRLKRNIIEQASAAIDCAYRHDSDERQIAEALQNLTLDISATEADTGKEEAATAILEGYADAKAGILKGVPLPFEKINKATGGAPKGLVTVLCGRGGKGKSMFLAHWLNDLGMKGIPATSFCLEDGIELTMARMASCRGKYSHMKMSQGRGRPDWYKLAAESLDVVKAYPVEFVSKKMTIHEIRNRLYSDKETRSIQLAIIDGFKDILRPGDKYNDTGTEEYLSQQLTDIARRLDIAIVVVHHLQKIQDGEQISLTNIRGSAQIVNDCRVAWALQDCVQWNDGEKAKYGFALNEHEDGTPAIYAFHVLKITQGVPCRVPIRKKLDISRFEELTIEDEIGA